MNADIVACFVTLHTLVSQNRMTLSVRTEEPNERQQKIMKRYSRPMEIARYK